MEADNKHKRKGTAHRVNLPSDGWGPIDAMDHLFISPVFESSAKYQRGLP